ncbi:hemin uptake protein HemP [Bradyrhizobium sp. SYSU BS000235]|uniref:hemin uptake protein HemP n=1 Tax=Bradyrhizobium sp. SYSU BS000235 TaxID=3411332 RepID=UPI003C79698D
MNADSRHGPAGSGGDAKATHGERSIPLADNRLNSRDLFASSREIIISHGDDIYRLRLTAQNKLILTK